MIGGAGADKSGLFRDFIFHLQLNSEKWCLLTAADQDKPAVNTSHHEENLPAAAARTSAATQIMLVCLSGNNKIKSANQEIFYDL